MSEENNPFGNIDLDMFQEAGEYLEKIDLDTPGEDHEQHEQPAEIKAEEIEVKPEAGVEKPPEESPTTEVVEEENKPPSSQEIKDSSRLTPYFKLLVEEGAFTEDDFNKWDGTTDGLMDLEHSKMNDRWSSYKEETLHPRVKWLQDNLEEGVAFEKLLKTDSERAELGVITEEALTDNTELQKKVAQTYFRKTTRFSDDAIQRSISRLEDSGELETESKTFSTELVKINEEEAAQDLQTAKTERIAAIRAQEENLSNFKDTLNKTEEIIPGLKVNNLMREKIFSTLTTQTSVDELGNALNKITEARVKDPVNFEIKLAYLFELTNGFTDYGSLSSSGKKKAFKDFENAATALDQKRQSTKSNIPANDGDFMDNIEKLWNNGTIK